MSTPSPSRSLPALGLLAVLLLAACTRPASGGPPSTSIDDAPAPEPAGSPHMITLATSLEAPDGRTGLVELRATVVGERRHVLLDSPLGPVGEHVVTPDDHWFRLPPLIADPLGFPTDWIHVPVDELAAVGAELPPSLADVRAPLPDPATVAVGDLVYGTLNVLAVDPRSATSVRLELDDGSVVDVRRQSLPADTTVEAPSSAIEVRDLPKLVRRNGHP